MVNFIIVAVLIGYEVNVRIPPVVKTLKQKMGHLFFRSY
jgi:hypothetical protein